MLIYLYSPFPSAVDRIYRRGSNLACMSKKEKCLPPWSPVGLFVCSDPPLPVMESGGLLPLLRSATTGESWESGEEWGEGAVRGGEANNCRRFGKQHGFSSVAARVQPPQPTCTARAWPWRNCRFVCSQ